MRRAFAVLMLLAGCDAAMPPAPCAGAVPGKGPYTMRPTATGATVYWETAAPGCVELGLTPEAGGSESIIVATQQETDITGMFGVAAGVARPDMPGTYYLNHADLTGLAAGTCYRYRVRATDGSESP